MLATAGLVRPRALLPTRGLGRWPSAAPVGPDTHDPGWITTDGIRKKRYDGTFEEPSPQQVEKSRREYIEEVYARLQEIPEARAKVEEIITVAQPDFRVLVRNQQVVMALTALYAEYLEDEDIIIMAASLL